MAFEFPEFTDPVAIDEQQSWTAVFVSYNQRTEDVYYRVTVHRGEQTAIPFMVQGDMFRFGDDWGGAVVVDDLRWQIHQVAVTGMSNTDYQGPLGWEEPDPR